MPSTNQAYIRRGINESMNRKSSVGGRGYNEREVNPNEEEEYERRREEELKR